MSNLPNAILLTIQIRKPGLRDKAETELGENFAVRQFHNQVLESGSVPLKLLEEKIDRWIEGEK